MKGRNLKLLVLFIASGIGNAALSHFVTMVAKIPLYADTMFTIAMCFTAGLLGGILTGALFSPLCFFLLVRYIHGLSSAMGVIRNIYAVCVIAEVFVVCLFYSKMKTREAAFLEKPSVNSFIGIAAQLLVLVAIDCVVISICGGIIDTTLAYLSVPKFFSPEDNFKLGLLRNNVPVLATAVLSRIPINIIDRFIAVFGGYGISLLFRKWLSPPLLKSVP